MSKYVISFGGNALGIDPKTQKKRLEDAVQAFIPLIQAGHDIVFVHGNGPQVGMIHLAFEESFSSPAIPLSEAGAMSQGYIGYHFQNSLQNALIKANLHRPVTTLISQVIVDINDPAMSEPTKPIGAFYDLKEAETLEKEKQYTMMEDAGRGYRRVVSSPKPQDLVEKDSLLTLLNAHHLVITGGGGGIPVVLTDDGYQGIEAVIDKDFASAKIAEIIEADALIILTDIDYVYLDYLSPNRKKLTSINAKELAQLVKEDHFKAGSMLPKIEACLQFVNHSGKQAIIASLNNVNLAITEGLGTIINP
ncbi:MAG: carbamate kinase [Acholeplasmataceae bacterium]|nr:carbamate kinase [Acholeplasmataceae bacterium]